MTSGASAARQRMIERQKAASNVRQDEARSDDTKSVTPSVDATQARQRMLARISGRTYSPPAYREDSIDPLAWYRAHLANAGYSASMIGRMLG
jgi:hypothetical protein